jgi:hypothetical protein
VTSFDQNGIEFQATANGKKITKRYTLSADAKNAPYCFDLEIQVEGGGKQPVDHNRDP